MGVHAIAFASMALLLSSTTAVNNYGESAPDNAECAPGTTFFQDKAEGIVGCYKLYPNAASWYDAKTDCEETYGGKLAASRNANEQTFVLSLALTTSFWSAGYSPSLTCAASSSCIWKWQGYEVAVPFSEPYIKDFIQSLDHATRARQALVNNFVTNQHWKYGDPVKDTHAYMCRRDACSPDKEVKLGVCTSKPVSSSSSEDYAWIAGVVIGVIILAIIVVLLLLWKFKNDQFNTLRNGCCCDRPTTVLKRRIKELEDENERLRAQLNDKGNGNGAVPRFANKPVEGGISGVAGLPAIKPVGMGKSPKSNPRSLPTSMPAVQPRAMRNNKIAPMRMGDEEV
jgi:hypothetical protein